MVGGEEVAVLYRGVKESSSEKEMFGLRPEGREEASMGQLRKSVQMETVRS